MHDGYNDTHLNQQQKGIDNYGIMSNISNNLKKERK